MRTLLAVLALAVPLALQAADPHLSAVQVYHLRFHHQPDGRTSTDGGWGSGTVVGLSGGSAYVLTNHHVVRGDGIAFALRGKQVEKAEVVAKSDQYDLALLKVKADWPAVELADGDPAIGTQLRQWGFSGTGPMRPKVGRVSATQGYKNDAGLPVLLAEMAVQHGDSGCLVVNPAGKGVAVCFAGYEGSGRQFCVPLDGIKAFLGKNLPGAPEEWKDLAKKLATMARETPTGTDVPPSPPRKGEMKRAPVGSIPGLKPPSVPQVQQGVPASQCFT